MPLLIHAVAWWLAGLMAGAWWHTPLPPALLLAAGVVLWRRARVEPLLVVAGLLASWGDARENRLCARRLQQQLADGGAAWVHVADHVPPRGRRPAQLRGQASERARWPRCHVPVAVHLAPQDSARTVAPTPRPGMRVPVWASPLPTGTVLRLERARVGAAYGPRHPLVAWRAHVGTVIDDAFRGRAPLVRALLIADQRSIDPEVRDRYADAGLVHLLSVSGMHVAIIATALLTLGGALRLTRRWLEPACVCVVVAYVALLGFPAPAVRSAIMLMVTMLSRRWQRPVHEWTALALGAVVPTIEPAIVHDLGWQLSVGGMAALVAARSLHRRWKRDRHPLPTTAHLARMLRWWHRQRGAAGWLLGEISTGLIATLVMAPLVAWTFGRVSLVAPLSNVVAAPLIGVLQPALFLALLAALLLPAGPHQWLADATQPLMALLDHVAQGAAAVPGAVLGVAPTFATALGTGTAVALLIRSTADRRRGRWVVGAAAVLTATLWQSAMVPGNGHLELHVLDVGQGDALALRTPRGRWILVDAGRRWQGGDAGRRVVVPYVRRRGGQVALFVLTHPHDDHAGGAASVVRALRPARWWEPAFVLPSPGYREALDALRETKTPWERVRPGRTFRLDGVQLTVLAPDSSWTASQRDANETSVVLRVDYGRRRLLLTGDAEAEEEAWLVAQQGVGALDVDVLKLGHHGSRTSSTAALLDAATPRLAIASVGAGNRYGHPSPETLAALMARGVPVFRTDTDGTVIVQTDGRTLQVMAGGEQWQIPQEDRVP